MISHVSGTISKVVWVTSNSNVAFRTNCFQIHSLVNWLPYWDHVEEGWKRRHNPNVLFIFYEEMKKVSSNSTEFTEERFQ